MSIVRPRSSGLRLIAFRALALLLAVAFAAGIGEAGLRLLGYRRSYFNPFGMFHERDALIGVRGRANFTGRLKNGEMDAIISNDENGFRLAAIKPPNAPGHPDVYVLGDSFIWGWGVGQGQVVTDLMQQKLATSRTHNLGVSATGTVQQFVIFEKYALPELRKDDWVVLAFCAQNDFADNVGRNDEGRLFAKVVDGKVCAVPPDGTACPAQTVERMRDASYLFNLVAYQANRAGFAWRTRKDAKAPKKTWSEEPYALKSPEFLVLEHYLKAFQAACQSKQAHFVVVYIPLQAEFGESDGWTTVNSSRERKTLQQCLRALDINLVDLLPRFRSVKAAVPDERLTFHEGHWNAAGHRVACDAICEFINARTLVASGEGFTDRHEPAVKK